MLLRVLWMRIDGRAHQRRDDDRLDLEEAGRETRDSPSLSPLGPLAVQAVLEEDAGAWVCLGACWAAGRVGLAISVLLVFAGEREPWPLLQLAPVDGSITPHDQVECDLQEGTDDPLSSLGWQVLDLVDGGADGRVVDRVLADRMVKDRVDN